MKQTSGRRRFLGAAGGVLVGLIERSQAAHALSRLVQPTTDHPDPRPGITAEAVLTAADLEDAPDAVSAFDMVREVPEIVDGIRCHCGCADVPGYYSLLTCYEGEHAMARHCLICQGQGRLTHRLHKSGRTLDQIRRAVDARYA